MYSNIFCEAGTYPEGNKGGFISLTHSDVCRIYIRVGGGEFHFFFENRVITTRDEASPFAWGGGGL